MVTADLLASPYPCRSLMPLERIRQKANPSLSKRSLRLVVMGRTKQIPRLRRAGIEIIAEGRFLST
jgi:hypothetical protein